MPSILTDADKETVKRTVPKAANKIQAVAVARLYVAHPNRGRWTYTGLQGAAVLSNDLVGNTFWLKLVDISPANRGVIWDQEIYDTFQYHQDRTFFHSFELEQCMAGLSFIDEKEARQFKKKMDEREKNASKQTKAQPFASSLGGGQVHVAGGSHKHHSRVGNFLRGHRHSSIPSQAQQPQSIVPQPLYSSGAPMRPQSSAGGSIDLSDPTWRPILNELLEMGITEDQIEENADFIKNYVKQKQAEEMANGIAHALPSATETRTSRAPPPPPPPPPAAPPSRISPDNTGTMAASRRGPRPLLRQHVGLLLEEPLHLLPPPPHLRELHLLLRALSQDSVLLHRSPMLANSQVKLRRQPSLQAGIARHLLPSPTPARHLRLAHPSRPLMKKHHKVCSGFLRRLLENANHPHHHCLPVVVLCLRLHRVETQHMELCHLHCHRKHLDHPVMP